MKIISTKTHGLLDYIVGLILIIAPWAFGFARGGAETSVPVVLGIAALIYSLFTNYEWGVVRTLSMRTHLRLDVFSGIFLAMSPWLFSFSTYVYIPHLAIGLFEILAGLLTESKPFTKKMQLTKDKQKLQPN